ncbi:LysR family transcriptional regulator [Ottowia caeni]|uniref:LysR family transcriptional regulator n=1 Tax=Ottowia caeni TaxID=2870339 RepID=UPI001E4EF4E7|nr:LysR family transcriptional regulator [Ottowia caeni]
MRAKLTLQQLEAFVQIVTTGSFRAAAVHVGVSQPALSRTIRQAEQILQARLFDRDTRNVKITPVGQELLPIAQRILGEFDNSFGELGQFLQGRTGRVSLGVLPSIGASLIPGAIASYRSQHPEVEFSLLEAPADALLTAIDEGRADFGLSVRPAPDRRVRYRHLMNDPLVLVCQRDDVLATRDSVPWSIFATRPYLASQASSSIRPITDAALLRFSVSPALEYPSISACGALVRAGLGITALPLMALDLIRMDGLATVPLTRPQVNRQIGIITRIGRTLPPVGQTFLDTLLDQTGSRSSTRQPLHRSVFTRQADL